MINRNPAYVEADTADTANDPLLDRDSRASQMLQETVTDVDITDATERYARRYRQLDAVDRFAAQSLNQFASSTASFAAAATKLATISAIQGFITSIPLIFADVFSVYFGLFVGSGIAERVLGLSSKLIDSHGAFFASLIVVPVAHLAGLYPGLGVSPILEFRQIARTVCVSLLVFFGLSWVASPDQFFLYALTTVLALMLTVPLATAMRYSSRCAASFLPFWGVPILILAEPWRGLEMYQRLKRTTHLGFRPCGVLLKDGQYDRKSVDPLHRAGVPVFSVSETEVCALENRVTWVVVSTCSDAGRSPRLDPSLAVIPNRVLLSSDQLDMGIWDRVYCIGSTSGLRFSGIRSSSIKLGLKRGVDIVGSAAILLLGAPVLLAIWAAIRLSSRGPAFYGQQRIGKDGTPFTAWKFRSMVLHADRVLDGYLAKHPQARQQWGEKRKLANDPRVTWIGKLLRTTSLDELPQLWNVLRGDMSLVGPRPIINSPTYDAAYVNDYPHEFEAYKSVRPGLTGLWQVRSRSSGVYELRIYWDMYYIRNWCIWLDLYILARTVRTVLLREGAS
jgi:Undecaprenyl-phosphate galactose phosphotransferase WbaP